MNSYNKTFIVLCAAILIVIGVYMVRKLNYIKEINQQDETTTTINVENSTTTTTTNTTVSTTTTKNNTTSIGIKTTKTTKGTTTTTQTQAPHVDPTVTTTTVNQSSSIIDEARKIASQNYAQVNELLNLVNELRRSEGISELTLNSELNVAASVRAIEMANNNVFSHTRPDGRAANTVLNDLGIPKKKMFGENVAYATGKMQAQVAFNQWKKSASHYENMVDPGFTTMGAGFYKSKTGETYWAQLFMG